FPFALALLALGSAAAQAPRTTPQAPPALPDSSGWGVHVLAIARDPAGALWVGTYGQGIFRLPPGASSWERIRSDTVAGSISWDFVNAFAFGPRGQIWYGTVGNGWGLSTDGGRSWKNWTYDQLGPEWQYVVPGGIATRGDTTMIATADGLQVTTDDGASWTAIGDTVGPPARGPADTALPLLANEYLLGLRAAPNGWLVRTQLGAQRLRHGPQGWRASAAEPASVGGAPEITIGGTRWVGTRCGLQPAGRVTSCLTGEAPTAEPPAAPRTAWLRRPIAAPGNVYLDQTYRYGSTMGGNFQQHQGVEFNNPDGTPVHATLGGTVVYAGRAEQGALTVAIRHDTTVMARDTTFRLYTIYYHNSALKVQVGDRVTTGQVISRVGNTGRATNDHLHLELAISPTDSIGAIVDSLQRFPPYTTNPELWLRPLPGTGVVAGQVFDSAGAPVRQARIYGLVKRVPVETPFSYIETYGDKAHPHPLYGEHFALGDVPAGSYVMGTEIDGKRVLRRVTVAAGRLTWVVFRP
ncbi:MAG TPA: peptidoglycan DD-metalloendopeptidase family protein, partial [Gemmatimonadales bacterium]|nr:peptidoglycan DD-metalloendopeptidase family protein [Gemmatimonadales bacterium]